MAPYRCDRIMMTNLKTILQQRPLQMMLLMSASILQACASTPALPEINQADIQSYVSEPNYALAFGEATTPPPNWWTNFDDRNLGELVELALLENKSIESAEANIRAAQATLRGARLGKSYSTTTTANAEAGKLVGSSGNFDTSFSGNVGAAWEYDAFGRIKSQIKAAEFDTAALIEVRRDLMVLISSQTSQAYTDLLGAQARLNVAEDNAELQQQALELVTGLVENGRSSDLELKQSETLYQTTLAIIPTLKADAEIAATQLAALTGLSVSDIISTYIDPAKNYSVPQHINEVRAASPADLLLRRPDIRQAEAEVARQLALSDVERSRLYPRINFNANFDSLFNGGNVLNQFGNFGLGLGPSITWDGPDLRSVRADIDASDALAEAAISQYEQTILDAISEVEAALARYARESERQKALTSASASAYTALELAQLRYEEGFDDFLDVLDAQRTLLDAQDDVVQNEILITTHAIDLYRAMGGMWSEDELETQKS